MPLSDQQRAFLQKYFTAAPAFLDRSDDTAAGFGPEGDLRAQKTELFAMLGALATPAAANEAEAKEIARLRGAALGSMDEPLTAPGLRAAADMIRDIEAVRASHVVRIQAERQNRRDILRQAVATVKSGLDEDLLPPDQLLVAAAIKAVTDLLAEEPPKAATLLAADEAVVKLRDLTTAANERAAADRQRRTEAATALRNHANKAAEAVDAEAPERVALLERAAKLAAELPQTPTDTVLQQTELALAELRDQATAATEKAQTARAARAARRQKIIDATAGAVVGAAETEAGALALNAAAVRALLPDMASDSDLNAATLALSAYEKLRAELAALVVDRNQRVERAKAALAAAVWGAGELIPAPGAPVAQCDALSQEAGTLALDLTGMTDLAQAHTWDEGRIKQLEAAVLALAVKVKALNDLVADALVKLALAVQKAETAITTAKGAKLTDTQLGALRPLIEVARKSAADDVSTLAVAEQDLIAIGGRAVVLARALALLDGRITRLTPTPAGALPSELKAIAEARKVALDALGKVAP